MKNVWCWAIVSMIVVTRVGAADYTWSGVSGSFQEASNWSPATVPGTADHAKFTSAGTYTVSFAGDVANTGSTVGANAQKTGPRLVTKLRLLEQRALCYYSRSTCAEHGTL